MSKRLWRIVERCDEDACLRVIASWAVFLALVQALTLALSAAGGAVGRVAAWAILVVSGAGASAAARMLRRRERPVATDDAVTPEPPPRAARVVLVAAAIAVVVLATVAWVGADRTCDGNSYHLTAVHFWMREGRVHWIDPDFCTAPFMNGYPKGAEVVAFVASEALGPGAVNTLNLLFLPLGVAGICLLARRLGATRWASIAAGAAWALVPLVITQAPTTYVDSAFASSVIAFLAVLAWTCPPKLQRRRMLSRPEMPWRSLPAAAATAALVIGIKASGPAFVAIGAAAFAGVLVFRRLRSPEARPRVLGALAFLAAALVLGAAVGGYWYARNWMKTGRAFYPAGGDADVEGLMNFRGLTPPALRRLPAALRPLYVWTQAGAPGERWPISILPVDGRFGGLGLLWLLGGIPAVLVMAWRSLRRENRSRTLNAVRGPGPVFPSAFAFLLIASAVTFAVIPIPWHPRYVLWLHGLGLASLAAALGARANGGEDAARPLSRVARGWMGVLVAAALVEAAMALGFTALYTLAPPVELKAAWQEGRLSELWGRRDWLAVGCAKFNPSGPLFEEILRGSAPVAFERSALHVALGALAQPVGRRLIVPLSGPVDAGVLTKLRAAGVRYVILGESGELTGALARAAQSMERTDDFTIIKLIE